MSTNGGYRMILIVSTNATVMYTTISILLYQFYILVVEYCYGRYGLCQVWAYLFWIATPAALEERPPAPGCTWLSSSWCPPAVFVVL